MAITLQTYLTEVQRLLHDANNQFWSQSELIDYINDARNRVASDTKCTRALASITLNVQTVTGVGDGTTGVITSVSPTPAYNWIGSTILGTGITGIVSSNPIIQQVAPVNATITVSGVATAGAVSFTYYQETYPFTDITTNTGGTIIEVQNITAIWGNTRYVLQRRPWSQYNALMRSYVSFQQRPAVWAMQGQNTVWIGPIVDQQYVTEWDCVVQPPTLSNLTDVETITYPFTRPVAFYAAYKAKIRDGSWPEAETFENQYKLKAREAIANSMSSYVPNVYRGL